MILRREKCIRLTTGAKPGAQPPLHAREASVIGNMKAWLAFRADQRAVVAIEYAVIAGLMAAIVFAAVSAFGASLDSAFNHIAAEVQAVL
jgi:pilus assembly protein Flp/PilA